MAENISTASKVFLHRTKLRGLFEKHRGEQSFSTQQDIRISWEAPRNAESRPRPQDWVPLDRGLHSTAHGSPEGARLRLPCLCPWISRAGAATHPRTAAGVAGAGGDGEGLVFASHAALVAGKLPFWSGQRAQWLVVDSCTKKPLVQFLVKTPALVVDLIPSGGGSRSMFVSLSPSHQNLFLKMLRCPFVLFRT